MHDPHPSPARIRRLEEELAEVGFPPGGPPAWRSMLLVEVDAALRPRVFERRVPSYGSIITPRTAPETWWAGTGLTIVQRPVMDMPLVKARLFADGLSSWLIRGDGHDQWAIFDRPAGSERDLVVLAETMDATLVQRHPTGVVRIAGAFGVMRWDGLSWHHEPPLSTWIDALTACPTSGDQALLETFLEFAVHDLGARGIGAILVLRDPDDGDPADQRRGNNGAMVQDRLPAPPPLDVRNPPDLGQGVAQVDGAAVFDARGVLRQLGVRLVPSPEAEAEVEGYRGMRHTAGRRYSYDDPYCTVIVVSEDGPVSVLRAGRLLGRSPQAAGVGPAPDRPDAA